MRRSVGRMHELINNVLDLTRSRLGGGIPLQIEERSIEPVLTQVIEELRIAHPEREIVVVLDTTEPVDCDQGRIGQLLSNLLGNALHHGPKDAPVRVDAVAKDGRFTLSVANAGEPIPREIRERLFQPFYRGEGRASSAGLGLGLYIASEIARAHFGQLSVRSDLGASRLYIYDADRTSKGCGWGLHRNSLSAVAPSAARTLRQGHRS